MYSVKCIVYSVKCFHPFSPVFTLFQLFSTIFTILPSFTRFSSLSPNFNHFQPVSPVFKRFELFSSVEAFPNVFNHLRPFSPALLVFTSFQTCKPVFTLLTCFNCFHLLFPPLSSDFTRFELSSPVINRFHPLSTV